MNILVTGVTGYIGSHTVVALIENNYKVIGIDNFSNSSPVVLERILEITGEEISFYQGDVTDKIFLENVFSEESIDAVIHFAAHKAVGESVENPIMYYRDNLLGFLSLSEVMKQFHVKSFIFSSSATVYGDSTEVPYKEELTLKAMNPYGATKIMIERMLSDIVVSDSDWKVVVLRYFNPIGAHPSALIGESPNGIPQNLMPYIGQVALGRRPYLSVFGSNYDTIDGTGVRDYIHVVDLAKGHVRALSYLSKCSGMETFNLGSNKGYSVLEVIKAFEKATGIFIPYEISEPRQGDVGVSYSDCTKANSLLKWSPERTIEEMCLDAWHWQKNNPKGYE